MTSILTVTDVNKSFGGLKALTGVNLSVEDGTVHAIIGPNGAGKSTLLNCFVGKLTPDTGSVMFNRIDRAPKTNGADQGAQEETVTEETVTQVSLLGLQPHEINQVGVSRVFQTPEIFGELPLIDNVTISTLANRDGAFRLKFWKRADDEAEAREMAEHSLEDVGLADKRLMVASSLSRGDKRRLELAMCLVQKPKLLLLDEPTAGMSRADTNATIDLLKKIGEQHGVTKVIIEHDMHVVFSLAQKVTVLAQGTPICEGKPDEIKGDPRVQEAYLGGAHL